MRKRYVSWLLILIVVGCGILYNFLLHRSFYPDPEYVTRQYYYLINDLKNVGYNIGRRPVSNLIALLAYKFDGFGIRSIRIEASLCYGILLLGATTISCIRKDNEGNIKFELYAIPIVFFLMIVINPGSSLYCGQYADDHHSYPYDFHIDAQFYAIWGLILISVIKKLKQKNIYCYYFILFAFCLIGFYYSDVLFGVTFICSLFISLVLDNRNNRVEVLKLISILLGIIMVLKLLSLVYMPLQIFFSQAINPSWGQGNSIYGDDGFGDSTEILSRVAISFTELMALFNIEFTNRAIVSFMNILNFFRLFIVISIFVISIRIVTEKIKNEEVDLIDFITSMGFLLNFIFLLLTKHGGLLKCNRYLVVSFWYGTILFIRYCTKHMQGEYKKYYAIIFSLLAIMNIKNITKDDYKPYYETQMEGVADAIINNKLGNGISTDGMYHMYTALLQSENVVLKGNVSENKITVEEEDIYDQLNYIIVEDSETDEIMDSLEKIDCAPDKVFDLYGYDIFYYFHGVEFEK